MDWRYQWYQRIVGVEKEVAGKIGGDIFLWCKNEVIERLQLLGQVMTVGETIESRMEGKIFGEELLEKSSIY